MKRARLLSERRKIYRKSRPSQIGSAFAVEASFQGAATKAKADKLAINLEQM